MSVDHDNDVLLLVCASGKQCSSLLPLLQGKWRHLRLHVNSQASEERLKTRYPEAEVVRASLDNVDHVRRIMCGVATVFHVGPSFHPREKEMGCFMVDAAVEEAKRGTFKHFIYSSVLSPQLRKLMNHDCKNHVEEHLMESGLNFTILQPSTFLDNFPIKYLAQQEKPVFPALWDTNVSFSYTALDDLAEAVSKVIEEREKHYMAQYAACSTMPMPNSALVAMAAKVLGKDVEVSRIPFQESVDMLCKRLYATTEVDARTRDEPERMILFYNRRGLLGNPGVLEWILGRKATAPEEWMRRQVGG
ncbi:uncharacterized protein J3D65DRAFT_601685 [Phyllosticta citribraziliensis]|uniref:NmrA-like domain-containing protein n=1 Tax=Phyllosticta citribraziliensis TaxID=989973 RepID=A0ABR1LXY6_9PEZI